MFNFYSFIFVLAFFYQRGYGFQAHLVQYKSSFWLKSCKQSLLLDHYSGPHGVSTDSSEKNEVDSAITSFDTSSLSEDDVADIEALTPSDWIVMKELLGVNIFTYILGISIITFFSLNVIFGPGWLGTAIGISGTGTINHVSNSLPEAIDLSKPDFLF